jgi:hypothetical protein
MQGRRHMEDYFSAEGIHGPRRLVTRQSGDPQGLWDFWLQLLESKRLRLNRVKGF